MRWLSGLPFLLTSSAALAQSATKAVEKPPESDGPVVAAPAAEPADLTTGHVGIVPSVGYTWPFGELEPGLSYRSRTSGGLALGLDLDLGISRTVSIGLWGNAALLTANADCNCDIRSFAGGPLIRYRLAQGVRLDPWVGVGFGARVTPVGGSRATTYAGFDWLHAALGGDWYAASGLSFGPVVSADFGTFVSPQSAFHWQLTAGVRVGLDVPGR